MAELTPSQKDAIAEARITAQLIELGHVVFWPCCEGGRYDLVAEIGLTLLRIQCKWGRVRRGVLAVRIATSRHTPRRGYVSTVYSADEIDALAVFSPDTGGCYLMPITEVVGLHHIHLRVAPTGNRQALGVRWARDFELSSALERYWGMTDGSRVATRGPLLRALSPDAPSAR